MTTTNPQTAQSADGTTIAFDVRGAGPTIVLLGGVMGDRAQQDPVADLLAPHFTVVNIDRRGHGASEFTAPYEPLREVEDLAAVIAQCDPDLAGVYATSGCAMIALQAALHGVPVRKLVLWEPPFVIDDSRPPVAADYKQRLQRLLIQDRRSDMLELFMVEAAAIPREFVAGMRQAPFWDAQVQLAHTLIYDADLMGDYAVPDEFATIQVSTLILDGGITPWLSNAADTLADILQDAGRETLPGQMHNVDPDAIAPAIARFLQPGS